MHVHVQYQSKKHIIFGLIIHTEKLHGPVSVVTTWCLCEDSDSDHS